MSWFKRKKRNRRLGQENVLNVRLRSSQVKAARLRMTLVAATICFGTVFSLYVVWRTGEWLLDRMVYQNPAFAIHAIAIQTDGQIKTDQLRRWAGVKEGANLVALDIARVKRDLELVSAIRSVAVERELPNTLRIRVTERAPIAEIGILVGAAEGGLKSARFQLDDEGYVVKPLDPRSLDTATNAASALPLVSGFRFVDIVAGRRLESGQIQAALQLIQLHECSSMGMITAFEEIDVSYPEILIARTTDGSQITFATANLEQQLRRWRQVYELGRASRLGISTLDLSVSNNVPAQWVRLDPSKPTPPPAPSHRTSRPKRRNV